MTVLKDINLCERSEIKQRHQLRKIIFPRHKQQCDDEEEEYRQSGYNQMCSEKFQRQKQNQIEQRRLDHVIALIQIEVAVIDVVAELAGV